MSAVLAYLVMISDHDSCSHAGYFATRDEAEAYAAELRLCVEEGFGTVCVEECRPRARRELRGAYVVEIDATGDPVNNDGLSGGWESYTSPDAPGWNDGGIVGAHWWQKDGAPVVTEWGAVIRAAGINREEALARARALLATASTPTSSRTSLPHTEE